MENKICPNCKVELDEGIDKCPLCEGSSDKTAAYGHATYPSEILQMSEQRSRTYIWELSAIIAFSAILVVLIVDLVIIKGIGWSLFAVTSIAGVWVMQTAFAFLFRKTFLLGLVMIVDILGMLLFYDLLNPPLMWFVGLGMPIGLSFCILFTGFLIILRRFKTKGFNILAFMLIQISILCVLIEIFIDLHTIRTVDIEWSAIAAVSLVPLSWILLFIHYRYKKGNDLSSYFHI